MKKIAIAVLMLMGLTMKGWSLTVSDAFNHIKDNTRVTLLKEAAPAYFYGLQEGNNKTSQAGVIDHVIQYEFLSLDLGWRTALNGEGNGFGVGGVGVQLDKLVTLVAPTFVDYVNSFIPYSAQGFWQAAFIGLDSGWDMERGGFRYAFHTGIKLRY